MSLRKDGVRLSVRIAKDMLRRVEALTVKLRVGKSSVIRQALDAGLTKLEQEDTDQ